jgi:hypothetical protein
VGKDIQEAHIPYNKTMLRSLALFLVAGVLTLAPLSASAATVNFFGPIIPDGTNGQPDCNCEEVEGPDGQMYPSAPDWGCVLQTIQNAIAVGVSFVVVIITLSIAYAGIMIMANPNNPGQREQGRSLVMNAIIGLVIVLTAWLIVDFVMKAFYNPSAAAPYLKGGNFAWNAIISDDSGGKYCFSPTATPKPTSTGDGGGALNPVPAGAGGGTTPPPIGTNTPPSGATTGTPGSAPSAPTSFNVSYSGTTATILWKKAESGVTAYTIGRWKQGDSTWTRIATISVNNAGSYEDKNLSPGTTYSYYMLAWNGTEKSPSTEILTITTSGSGQATTGTVPPNPISLTTALSGTTKVNLSWSPVTGTTAFQIDVVAVAAGASAPTDAKAWTAINPPLGTSYTYSIPTASQTNSSIYFRLWAKNGSVYSKAPATSSVTLRSGSTSGGGTSAASPAGCSSCVKVTIPHKDPPIGCELKAGFDGVAAPSPPIVDCYMNSLLHTKVGSALKSEWWVSEMWPPTVNHGEDCHANGTCVDVAKKSGSPTVEQIIAQAKEFKTQGLYAVFESNTLSATQCQQILDGIPSHGSQVKVLKINYPPHFSVYMSDEQKGSGCIGF